MRIDKYIASQRTDISRSEVKRLLRAGAVTVDGRVVKAADFKVCEGVSEVCLEGEAVEYREHIYIMLNKPAGYVCSTRDGRSPTVLELVPPQLRRRGLFPAGRLDKDTEGFVLITDDGELAHRMLAPSRHVPKTYLVELAAAYDEGYEEIFARGVAIDGGEVCRPAECVRSGECQCILTICEGKFHQVKRMFAAVGNEVVYLRRIAIGGLSLSENLAPGECLEILHKDVEKLLCAKI